MKIFFWTTRLILALFFIVYGIKNFSETNDIKEIGISHLNIMKSYLEKYIPSLQTVKIEDYKSTIFTFAQNNNLAFIYGGFLMIFGFSFGKIFTFSALAFQAFLVASPRVAQDDFGFCSALAYLSLLGLTLHV